MNDPITIPSEVSETVKWIITAIVVPFLGYLSRKITKIDDKIVSIESKVDTANTTLIGQDGKNGLRSRFIKMETKVENLALAVASRGIQVKHTESGKDEDA
jgi:hypothetical protein